MRDTTGEIPDHGVKGVRLMDPDHASYGINQIGNKPRVVSTPIEHEIADGNVSGYSYLTAFGENTDVDNVLEDIIPWGGTYTFPDAAGIQMEVVSSSADDAAAGTGARTVKVSYLDADLAQSNEMVTLNGTTAVATTATDIRRVQNLSVATVGTGLVAAGNIDIRAVANTPIYARIPLGFNYSHTCVRTIPAGFRGHIESWQVSVGSTQGNRYGRFYLMATTLPNGTLSSGGIFRVLDSIGIQDAGIVIPVTVGYVLPAGTDIKISVISDSAAANAICTGLFEGWKHTV